MHIPCRSMLQNCLDKTLTVDKAKRDTVFLFQLCGAVRMQFGNTKGCIQKSKRYSYELKINLKYFCVSSF